jgi:hypothetical protein
MFDFFKRPTYSEPVPYIETPKKEYEPKTVYSIGATAEGTHITFKMGYTTLTMNKKGCEDLIEQLEVFKNQLKVEE